MTIPIRAAAAAPGPDHPAFAIIDANMNILLNEREQSRTMIEQGTQLVKDGTAGLERCRGAEIALTKTRFELLEALKKIDEDKFDPDAP